MPPVDAPDQPRCFVIPVFTLALLVAVQSEPAERERVLVLDLETSNVGKEEAALLQQIVTQSLARLARFEVSSAGDLRNLSDVESKRMLSGCDEQSAACLAELAGALGARYIVTGTAGRLGTLMILTLSLVDTTNPGLTRRERIEAARLEDLPRLVDNAVGALTGTVIASSGPAATPPSALALGAGIGAGAFGIAAVGAGVWATSLELALANPATKPADKQAALDNGALALGVTAACGVLALVSGAVAVVASLGEAP